MLQTCAVHAVAVLMKLSDNLEHYAKASMSLLEDHIQAALQDWNVFTKKIVSLSRDLTPFAAKCSTQYTMMANTSQEKVLLLHTGIIIMPMLPQVATGSMKRTLIEVFGSTTLILSRVEAGLTNRGRTKELGLPTIMIHLLGTIQLLAQIHQVA
jgi:hypothetical protein